jgi:3-oxoacyl-[acyl-carrier-protein] synthase II
VGFGNSSDAGHITAPDAEGRGAGNAMRWALEDAGLNPQDIDYVNAHGTSTPLGDKAEVAAVKKIFGDHGRQGQRRWLMSSTKSVHGHTLGASGAVEMIACLHAVNEGIVAPTINLDQIDPECDGIDLVPNSAREMKVRYAMNNTFGFGGHNVTLVCTAYRP